MKLSDSYLWGFMSHNPTWRIIPFSKWFITMVIVSPLTGVVGPLTNGRTPWLINGGDPNHLLTGVILQIGFQILCKSVFGPQKHTDQTSNLSFGMTGRLG